MAQDSPDIRGSILNVETQVTFAPHPVFYNLHLNNAFTFTTFPYMGHAVAQLVEALHYKPEGRGFDSQWSHWNFSLT